MNLPHRTVQDREATLNFESITNSFKAYKLNEFAAPTASVAMGNQKITGLANGAAATDAVNKGQLDAAVSSGAAPPGIISAYAGSTAPGGFLLCDGTAVSRTTYAALFAVTGTTYGAGDGSTTFNVPDLRE